MKQLTVFEMEEISGGYSWDFSSFSSAIASLVSNGFEEGGGIIGMGAIGQGVGMIWDLIVGATGGAVYGAMGGWEFVQEQARAAMNARYNDTLAPWG